MKGLPIGIENFKTMIDKEVYYIDKSELIKDVVDEQIVLYTRPRRFGKTLNMSMLYYFFSNKEKDNAYLFNGLKINKYPEVMKHQNRYPVIFITLKDMKNMKFENQIEQFASLIADIIKQNIEILDDNIIDSDDINRLKRLKSETSQMTELKNSLKYLSSYLKRYYQQKVIILIDEYDVPLQSAYVNGYYDEMVDFLRSVFSTALKTNDSLERGVLTGCLRISKESIFTGLNNLNVYSILDDHTSTLFGFTEEEVRKLLSDYQMEEKFDEVREWYDGYLFGSHEMYNPWSVLKYVQKYVQEKAAPESFWANTSGNDIIYRYIKDSDVTMKEDFERLLQGKSIIKTIKPELTYRDMDNINHIYSFLLLTGYLKIKEERGRQEYELIIPNRELYEIYQETFMEYFQEYTGDRKKELYQALSEGKAEEANIILNDILERSISYYDNYENFYHGFMIGLFSGMKVESNRESGKGRFDC